MAGKLRNSEGVENLILQIRGIRVILDEHIASLYGVSTKQLNQQVKRNLKRFPPDFAFRLTHAEYGLIRSQNVTTSRRPLGSLPWAFTEHGAIMLASVLNSPLAIDASVRVVRAFVRLRQILAANRELAQKLDEIEKKLEGHDGAILQLFSMLREMLDGNESEESRRQIGFHVKDGAKDRVCSKVGI
jgi:hypothetical protein